MTKPTDLVDQYERGDRLKAEDVNAIIRAIKARTFGNFGDTDGLAHADQHRPTHEALGRYDLVLESYSTDPVPPYSVMEPYGDGVLPQTTERLDNRYRVRKPTDDYGGTFPLAHPRYVVVDGAGIPAWSGSGALPRGRGSFAVSPCVAAIYDDRGTDPYSFEHQGFGNLMVGYAEAYYEFLLGPSPSDQFKLQRGYGPFIGLGQIFSLPNGSGGSLSAQLVIQDLAVRAYGAASLSALVGSDFQFAGFVSDNGRYGWRNAKIDGSSRGIQVLTTGHYRYHIWGSVLSASSGYGTIIPSPGYGYVTVSPKRYNILGGSDVLNVKGDATFAAAERYAPSSTYDNGLAFCGGSFSLHGYVDLRAGDVLGATEVVKVPASGYTLSYGNGGIITELVDRYRLPAP